TPVNALPTESCLDVIGISRDGPGSWPADRPPRARADALRPRLEQGLRWWWPVGNRQLVRKSRVAARLAPRPSRCPNRTRRRCADDTRIPDGPDLARIRRADARRRLHRPPGQGL